MDSDYNSIGIITKNKKDLFLGENQINGRCFTQYRQCMPVV